MVEESHRQFLAAQRGAGEIPCETIATPKETVTYTQMLELMRQAPAPMRLNYVQVQSNFNGSNTFGTIKICMSRTLNKFLFPSRGSNRGPFDLEASTLPRRYKSRVVPQGSTSVSYT